MSFCVKFYIFIRTTLTLILKLLKILYFYRLFFFCSCDSKLYLFFHKWHNDSVSSYYTVRSYTVACKSVNIILIIMWESSHKSSHSYVNSLLCNFYFIEKTKEFSFFVLVLLHLRPGQVEIRQGKVQSKPRSYYKKPQYANHCLKPHMKMELNQHTSINFVQISIRSWVNIQKIHI